MPRQHEQVCRAACFSLRDRGEPFAQRIGVRLGDAQRHVRADARQHLIAGDQYARGFVEQAGMFRAVAGADDDAPVLPADRQRVAILDPRVAERERRDDPAEAGPAAFAGMRDLRRRPSRARARRRASLRELPSRASATSIRAVSHSPRVMISGAAWWLAHPAGQPDMIGVDNACRSSCVTRTPAIGPANTAFHASRASPVVMPVSISATPSRVVEQPAIDVLQRAGNVQPDPVQPGHDLHHVASFPVRRRRTDRSAPCGWSR